MLHQCNTIESKIHTMMGCHPICMHHVGSDFWCCGIGLQYVFGWRDLFCEHLPCAFNFGVFTVTDPFLDGKFYVPFNLFSEYWCLVLVLTVLVFECAQVSVRMQRYLPYPTTTFHTIQWKYWSMPQQRINNTPRTKTALLCKNWT